jgi:hypothetical protein
MSAEKACILFGYNRNLMLGHEPGYPLFWSFSVMSMQMILP